MYYAVTLRAKTRKGIWTKQIMDVPVEGESEQSAKNIANKKCFGTLWWPISARQISKKNFDELLTEMQGPTQL